MSSSTSTEGFDPIPNAELGRRVLSGSDETLCYAPVYRGPKLARALNHIFWRGYRPIYGNVLRRDPLRDPSLINTPTTIILNDPVELLGVLMSGIPPHLLANTILTVFAPLWLTDIARRAAHNSGSSNDDVVYLFPGKVLPLSVTSLFSYTLSFAVFLQLLILPFFSIVAAQTPTSQKRWFLLASLLGSLFLFLIAVPYGPNWWQLSTLFAVFSTVMVGIQTLLQDGLYAGRTLSSVLHRVSAFAYSVEALFSVLLFPPILVLYYFLPQSAVYLDFAVAGLLWLVMGLWGTSLLRPRKMSFRQLLTPARFQRARSQRQDTHHDPTHPDAFADPGISSPIILGDINPSDSDHPGSASAPSPLGAGNPRELQGSPLSGAGAPLEGRSERALRSEEAPSSEEGLPEILGTDATGLTRLALFRDLGWSLWHEIPQTLLLLVAIALYLDGVHTLVWLLVFLISEDKGYSPVFAATVFLVGLLFAPPGSLMCEWLSRYLTPKYTVLLCIFFLSAGPLAFAFLDLSAWLLILIASFGAFVVGGLTALSRSLYGTSVPASRSVLLFSFYEVSSRGSSLFGPLLFGVVNQVTGEITYGTLSLLIFFVFGAALLFFFSPSKAQHGAEIAEARLLELSERHFATLASVSPSPSPTSSGP